MTTIAIMEQRIAQRHSRRRRMDGITPLFVPGDRPDRAQKAIARGAQAVVVDLEDAVEDSAKGRARTLAAECLQADWGAVARIVRVNGLTSRHELASDLEALAPVLAEVDAIILPKAETAGEVRELEAMLRDSTPADTVPVIVPTVESASGVFAAGEIAAASPLVHTLLFGVADLSAQLGLSPTPEGRELHTARSLVVLACAAAGVSRPWDGPYLNLEDDIGLSTAAAQARSLGFQGMVAIHPAQLPVIAEAFRPSPEEISWATRVVEAFTAAQADGTGALRLSDGTFVDRPIVLRAESLIQLAQQA